MLQKEANTQTNKKRKTGRRVIPSEIYTYETVVKKRSSLTGIQQKLIRAQIILILSIALLSGVLGVTLNLHFKTQKRDDNLRNVAEVIAHSLILQQEWIETENQTSSAVFMEYMDSFSDTLDDVDAISVIRSSDYVRIYHSDHSQIGTTYDGMIPEFEQGTKECFAAYDNGSFGLQRRAYAVIYDENGEEIGFVISMMKIRTIFLEALQTVLVIILVTGVLIFIELLLSRRLLGSIRESLLGYEPDVFSSMYKVRDNILESLAEGIVAIDQEGIVQYENQSAAIMLEGCISVGQPISSSHQGAILGRILEGEENGFNIREQGLGKNEVLVDRILIQEDEERKGAVAILHNRKEYTKLMEDLAGSRYLVDSMRANNHDFTNKLHVILGLLQMGMYEKAQAYIENISLLQRESIHNIMEAVEEPAVAALLIGKTARASELNIRLSLREKSIYRTSDISLPSEALVTVLGNLIDNALEAMDAEASEKPGELTIGIYTHPGSLVISADDTGKGISGEDLAHIFENGYSTKGEGRGTGLFQVKNLVEGLGGTITVDSQQDIGTSILVNITKK